MTGRVIVVTDNPEAGTDLIQNILAPAGYDAVLDTPDHPPGDLLLVDISRLRGTPLAPLRARRASGDKTPAILLAAHLPDDLAAEVFRLDVADFLIKPIRPDSLLNSIEILTAASADRLREFERLAADNTSLHRRLEDWRSAVSIGRAVVQIHDVETLLERIVEAAVHLSEAEEGALYLVDPASGELILRASRDADQTRTYGMRLLAPDAIASQVLRSGEPVLRRSDAHGPGLKVKTGHLVHSLINLPLILGDRRVGVLGVYHRHRGRSFDDRQFEALVFLADWAAIAIESAQRFTELQTRLTQKSQALGRARSTGELPGAALLGPKLNELRQPIENISEELGRLLAATYGPLRPAQADCLARLRQQAGQLLVLLDQLGAPRGDAAVYADDPHKEARS